MMLGVLRLYLILSLSLADPCSILSKRYNIKSIIGQLIHIIIDIIFTLFVRLC